MIRELLNLNFCDTFDELKREKNTNFPILSRILFIDLFLSSFKYIRIVFFFFLFSFRTDIDLRGRPMGFIPINAAIRDIRIDYNNTLPEAKRYFFFKLRLRARKIIEREREYHPINGQ